MLPSSGLFKDIDCPYYDNYCGRPYCHFRHRKRSQDPTEDSQDGEMATAEFPTYKPTPKSQLAQVKSHIPISYVPDTVIRPERISRMPPMYNFTEKVTYKPTPLSELSKNNAINTVNLLATDLYKIGDDKIDETAIDKLETKNDENCDIDFEELSTEFDMIDDIINENPCVENEAYIVEKQEKEQKTEPKKDENSTNSNKTSDKNKSSRDSSKNSTSKSKEDKPKTSSKSRSSSSSSSSHKSSQKSKSDKRSSRSTSKEKKSKEKSSDSKSKDDKKHEKKHKSSSGSSASRDKRDADSRSSSKDKDNKSKDCKRNSTSSSSSSKHKEYDKSKRKEKEKDSHNSSNSSKVKHGKESKSSSNKKPKSAKGTTKEISKFELSEEELDNKDLDDDMFPEDLEEECYRIFNEYKPEIVSKPLEVACDNIPRSQEQQQVEEYVPTSKKRIAHVGADQFVSKVNHVKPKPVGQNAALQMASRYKMVREAQVQEENDIVAVLNKHGTKRQNLMLESYQNMKKAKLKQRTHSDDEKMQPDNLNKQQQSVSLVDDIINGQSSTLTELTYKPTPISKLSGDEVKNKPKKIAPAMNISTIQQAKIRIAEFAKKKEILPKTPIQTLGKGNKRVAHVPDTSLAELPDVLQPDSKKIPVNVRTRYLTMIADECVKLYLSKEDAYSRAVSEEFKVMERCAAIITYRNSGMLAVNRIRKEVQEREAKGLGPISSGESSASNPESQFRGKKFYENILTYLLKEDELEEHGYPREGPIPGNAVVKCTKQLPRVNLDDNQRLCCRCFKVYLIDDRGFPLYQDDCIYHSLKKRTLRGERMYLCCKSTDDSGCLTSNTHVSESDETDLLGFQTTMDPSNDNDARNYAVYALDCEMCYTTKGLELTRVTIIDPECKTVYESLVKPLNPIIDYNTQFSGITKEQMDRTSTSILQVQANILHLCNSNTILIGHSLESDLKALKIVHSCVIDTSILFPHRMGLPHKRALRALASEYLNKIIQSDVGGHDSAEDAITCMELVIWKLKEDLKVKGIK